MEKIAYSNSAKKIKIHRILSGLRLLRIFDAAVFTGIPLLGIFAASQHAQIMNIEFDRLAFFIFAVYLLALHIFLINDWADYHNDRNDADKTRNHLPLFLISPPLLLSIAVALGMVSLILLMSFSVEVFTIGLMLVVLSLAYSTSSFFLSGKAIPLLSSLLHLTGGLLAFVLGYHFYGPVHHVVFIGGLMFGLFLSAGHLFQEIQDFQGDIENNIRTTAHYLGKKRSAMLGLGFLLGGHGILQYLIHIRFFPGVTVANWSAFVLLAVLIGFSLTKDLNHDRIKQLRNRYRIVYALFGMYILISSLYQIH